MKKKIKLKDLKKIIRDMPKQKFEKDNNSWGDVSVHYDELVDPWDVIYYVDKFLENK